MPGRMESVENLVEAAVPGSRNRGWFSTLPTAPWKSLRDSHSSTAPTTTILSYHQGDISTWHIRTFSLGGDTGQILLDKPRRVQYNFRGVGLVRILQQLSSRMSPLSRPSEAGKARPSPRRFVNTSSCHTGGTLAPTDGQSKASETLRRADAAIDGSRK